jgi:Met-zincin/Domain of unknown function (DUF5117)
MKPISRLHPLAAALAWCVIALAAGCAALAPAAPGGSNATGVTARAPTAAAIPASGVPPGSPQPGGPPPGSPAAFASVVRDAKKIDGLFTLYQRDEKVWLELKPEDFGKAFYLAPKIATGIGEPALFGGSFDEARVIEFRRIHNQVQMLARNTRFIAKADTPEARALGNAFSPSLLASATVASQPNAATKGVLVELNSLFLNDMLALALDLQRAYRQGYGFDPRNSAITALRGTPEMVVIELLAHYATGSISVPQPGAAPGTPGPTVPRSLPDPRSLFATLRYSLSRLPEQPMAAREADARLGHFTTLQEDYGDDVARTPVQRHITRWRLEKKDPLAELSEPVKPLVFWLDRTIPLKYRDAVSAGVLEWNAAFERIGFKNAIDVKVPADEGEVDTLDIGHAAVRWTTNSSPANDARAHLHVDPRSGEILGASVNIESFALREQRALRSQVLADSATSASRLMQGRAGSDVHEVLDSRACTLADEGAAQMGYALDVLAARGELDPEGADAQAYVSGFVKWLTMHEVGHTLGLRHNFSASRIYTEAQLADREFTRTHGVGGSVMDYMPAHIAAPGAKAVQTFQAALGPYDFWAIEYAYRGFAPADEAAQLKKIAARSSEPELAFGTDEDNYLGIDPDALQWDLGKDPVAFATTRLAIANDLFKRQESRPLPPDQDYAVLRRSLGFAVGDAGRSVGVLARQIGGVRTLRDFPGSGRDPLQPVPAAAQRAALDVMAHGLLAADAFVVSPALQRRLAPDFQARGDALFSGDAAVATDFSLTQRVLGVQRALLNQLMSDAVAARILDSQGKAATRGDAFQLSELYGRLERDIWSELADIKAARSRDIPAPRRALQREHLNRVAALLLRPSGSGRADAHSLVRVQAQSLLVRVNAAVKRPALDADTRAHLQDCADTLSQALSAKLMRLAV